MKGENHASRLLRNLQMGDAQTLKGGDYTFVFSCK